MPAHTNKPMSDICVVKLYGFDFIMRCCEASWAMFNEVFHESESDHAHNKFYCSCRSSHRVWSSGDLQDVIFASSIILIKESQSKSCHLSNSGNWVRNQKANPSEFWITGKIRWKRSDQLESEATFGTIDTRKHEQVLYSSFKNLSSQLNEPFLMI